MIQSPSKRFLSNKRLGKPADTLSALAAAVPDDVEADHYGVGPLVDNLERTIASLLGKEAAIFCLSGRAAQLAALRVHAQRRGMAAIAAHPRSHIVEDENDAIGTLYGLRVVRLGALTDPFTSAQLGAVHEPLAAVTVELPLRRAGYRVPAWDELVAIARQTAAFGAALHLDGARLWETAPGYGKSLAEICALADTVYVSFYKGLGGLAGAALAGDAATVAAARTWIGRAGAIVYAMFPYALAAREGLRLELPRMAEYHARAAAYVRALHDVRGVAASPEPPACNAFVIHLEGEREALIAARDAVADARGLTLFEHLTPTPHPRVFSFEVVIGPTTAEIAPGEVRDAFSELIVRARR